MSGRCGFLGYLINSLRIYLYLLNMESYTLLKNRPYGYLTPSFVTFHIPCPKGEIIDSRLFDVILNVTFTL